MIHQPSSQSPNFICTYSKYIQEGIDVLTSAGEDPSEIVLCGVSKVDSGVFVYWLYTKDLEYDFCTDSCCKALCRVWEMGLYLKAPTSQNVVIDTICELEHSKLDIELALNFVYREKHAHLTHLQSFKFRLL